MAQASPSLCNSFENIIDKLTKIEDNNSWKNWTLQEKKQLLDIYFIISKKETHIFDLTLSQRN